jgi:hypothetical protein
VDHGGFRVVFGVVRAGGWVLVALAVFSVFMPPPGLRAFSVAALDLTLRLGAAGFLGIAMGAVGAILADIAAELAALRREREAQKPVVEPWTQALRDSPAPSAWPVGPIETYRGHEIVGTMRSVIADGERFSSVAEARLHIDRMLGNP